MTDNNKTAQPPSPHARVIGPDTPRRIDVRELLGDGRELRILHGAQEYRLTLTSKDKLILTK